MTNSADFAGMTADEQVESLRSCVGEVLEQYSLVAPVAESINHEYNSTFKVSAGSGEFFALRINVNSQRSIENLNAEIFMVNAIESVKTPKPVANKDGSFVTTGWHEVTGRKLNAVLYTWLDGEEPGDEPTDEQLFALGVAMAKLHVETLGLELPLDAELSDYTEFFWGSEDLLTGDSSELNSEEKALVAAATVRVDEVVAALQETGARRPIHADLHPWNVMWHEGELSVFDFDDSGVGLPVQDLATSLYYLDTPEQDEALLAGYKSVSALPEYTEQQMKLLLLQRRILLLNYLYETSNPEHREMIPAYQEETLRRIRNNLTA
jgi:Ser/Thr protein kinase RdoA (MazF antagonist)